MANQQSNNSLSAQMLSPSDILSHFPGKHTKAGKNSYRVKCPCHNGSSDNSLSLMFLSDKVLIHDFGGCDTESILGCVGLSWSDIGCAARKDQKEAWRSRLEYGQKKKYGETAHIVAIYDYIDERGVYLYSKIRIEWNTDGKRQKKTPYIHIDYATDSYSWGAGTDERVLFYLPSLLRALDRKEAVAICEGEKDAVTLRKAGWNVTTPGGSDDWKKEYAKYFVGARVFIFPDNDNPGMKFCKQVMNSLRDYAHSVCVVPTSEESGGDVTDYFQSECSGDVETLKKNLQVLANHYANYLFDDPENNTDCGRSGIRYAPWINAVPAKDKEGMYAGIKVTFGSEGYLSDSIIRKMPYIIVRNEGDDKDIVYMYRGGCYQLSNSATIKAGVKRYLITAHVKDSRLNAVKNLIIATNEHRKTFEDLDNDPGIINFQNGIYDVKQKKLVRHSEKNLSTIQLQADYRPDAHDAPTFYRFIDDLCRGVDGEVDQSRKMVLQEYGGYVLSNYAGIKKCLILYSEHGDTGKSQYLGLLSELLGLDKVANVSIQDMNERGGNRFLMGSIVGKRLICNGDQKRADVEDSSIFKQLTGGDAIKSERKGKDSFIYRFKGALMMGCNGLPNFIDDKGGHLYDRLLIVPCDNIVAPERRDPGILSKMLSERSAVVNWFLEGLHRLIENGMRFTNCEAAEKTKQAYRENQDTVYQFIRQYYVITRNRSDKIKTSDFHTGYYSFCEDEGIDVKFQVKRHNLKKRMSAEGVSVGTVNGYEMYVGIREKTPDEVDFEAVQDNEAPFDEGKNQVD